MDLIALFENYIPPLVGNEEESIDLFDELFGDFIEETDYRSYLHKESVIQSLVRNKKPRIPRKDSEYQSFLDSINYEKLLSGSSHSERQTKVLNSCYRHIVAPLLMQTDELVKANGYRWPGEDQLYSFRRYFPEEEFKICGVTENEQRLMRLCMVDKSEPTTVKLCFQNDSDERKVLLPLTGKIKKNFCWTSRKIGKVCMPYTTVIDGTCLSQRVFVMVARKLFFEYLGDRALNDVRDDVVIGETLWNIRKLLIRNHVITENLMIIDVEVCKRYGYDIPGLMKSVFNCEVLVKPCDEKEGLKERHLPYLYFFLDTVRCGLNSISLSNQFDVAFEFFMLFVRQHHEEKRHERYERELADSAARVFETKRNIPEKYLKSMAASRLNDVFGYVEIDADCDLDQIKEIEKEFLGFKQEFFKNSLFKDHAIRFRKLGRHHASGLYFPSIRCLCVDIRTPSSFIHEYLHMIDHSVEANEKDHSARRGFYAIRVQYEVLLRSWMKEQKAEDPVVKVLKGNTKYNLSYYLEPTEIFARCGEMYFKRIMEVNSSLLGCNNGFAYPQDEGLMRMVKEYFDSLFGLSSAEEEIYEAAVS